MFSKRTRASRDIHAVAPPAAALLHRVVLDDHARLPWRFFGRLTAAVLGELCGR